MSNIKEKFPHLTKQKHFLKIYKKIKDTMKSQNQEKNCTGNLAADRGIDEVKMIVINRRLANFTPLTCHFLRGMMNT